MTIIEIERKPEYKTFNAIVKLNYDEIRDLDHGMYQLCKNEENKKNTSYHETHKEIALLFDLVKNGHLDDWSIAMLNDLQEVIKESRKKETLNEGV